MSARRSLVERRIGQKVSYLTRSEQDRLTSGPNVFLGFLKDRETGFWEQELIRFGWGVVSRPCFYSFVFFASSGQQTYRQSNLHVSDCENTQDIVSGQVWHGLLAVWLAIRCQVVFCQYFIFIFFSRHFWPGEHLFDCGGATLTKMQNIKKMQICKFANLQACLTFDLLLHYTRKIYFYISKS